LPVEWIIDTNKEKSDKPDSPPKELSKQEEGLKKRLPKSPEKV
jgi:hypothetical protein